MTITTAGPLTTSEAARLLRVSESCVRALERAGKLPAARTQGGQRIFQRLDVERLARAREEQRGR
jgi:excisionase family DNA binding protein